MATKNRSLTSQPPMSATEFRLWAFVTALLLIDVVTTWYVIGKVGLVAESNPVMTVAMEHAGRASLLPSKLVIYVLGFALRPYVTDGEEYMVPLGVALPATAVAVINTVAVLTLVL